MAARQSDRLDLIIFGATGYTGQYVIEHVVKTIDKENHTLTWGVAGRNRAKLQQSLAEVSKWVGKNLDSVPIVIADVNDEQSIKDMCSKGRMIVNCVGPYQLCTYV